MEGSNLNFSHKFDSTGKALTADADFLTYVANTDQFSPITIYGPDGALAGSLDRRFVIPSTVRIYAGKVDYVQPMTGKTKISVGVKSSYVYHDVESRWLDKAADSFVPDYRKSNHFQYTESINAAYVSWKKSWSRWGASSGCVWRIPHRRGTSLSIQ
jgi:hypothetical protein